MTIQAKGHSLWWVPGEPVFSRIAETIRRLAEAHQAPVFPPHITLLGGLPGGEERVIEGAEALACTLAAVPIRLEGYGHERVPTRWLFRFVSPTSEVMSANEAARRAFPSLAGERYTPHLSLMYGDYDDALRRAIISDEPAPPVQFVARALHVVRTEGPVADWGEIARLPLRAGAG